MVKQIGLVLLGLSGLAFAQAPIRVNIVTGENSYKGHVWQETSAELRTILEADKRFKVEVSPDPNRLADDQIFGFDVAVLDFRNADPLASDEKVRQNLVKFLEQGKGIVTIHWADGAFPYWPEYVNIVGRDQQSKHDPRGPFMVRIADPNHPITRGMKDFETDDELYYDFKEGNRPVHILATAHSKVLDKDFPMALTVEYGKGRVFNTPMGHDVKALKVPEVGELIRRGTAWAAGK
jgi:type 1 glutamine amidotransferase